MEKQKHLTDSTTIRVAIIQNVITSYRRAFYERLLSTPGLSVDVFGQENEGETALKLEHNALGSRWKKVDYISMKYGRLFFQFLPVRKLLSSYDVFVFYGSTRYISNVLCSIFFRLLGRPVIIWGQGQTFGGKKSHDTLRMLWWRRFKYHIVYTDKIAERLLQGPLRGRHVVGMNNGLDQKAIDAEITRWPEDRLRAWRKDQGLDGRVIVLSCGRLLPKNEFDRGLDAIARLRQKHPEMIWCVIGDGREREKLHARAETLDLGDSVRWLGAIFDEEKLAPWFLSSRVQLHPSGIGLSLFHAFGYGLPVVTHDNPDHQMPEFDALRDMENGVLYRYGSQESLADTLERLLNDAELARNLGVQAQKCSRKVHNVDIMAARIAGIITAAAESRQSAPTLKGSGKKMDSGHLGFRDES